MFFCAYWVWTPSILRTASTAESLPTLVWRRNLPPSSSLRKSLETLPCSMYTMDRFKNFGPKIVFSGMQSYQDLLSRHVLGHAIRMFLLRRWYHPSALCTESFSLLFHFSSKSLLNVCSIWGSGKYKECLLFKNTNIIEVRYEI